MVSNEATLSEPQQPGIEAVDWEAFGRWLEGKQSARTIYDSLSYAKKFGHCLFGWNLSDIQGLSDSKRHHVLGALSALAKYLGKYQEWKQAVSNFGLKWAGQSTDQLVIDRLTKIQDPGEVYAWIRKVKRERPELSDFMDFMAITGMRLIETVEAYNLIIKLGKEGRLGEYYNETKGILEHFRFKEIFIRKTKKAFISFVPKDLIQRIAGNMPIRSRGSVQKLIQRKDMAGRFGDIREAHASFLTKYLKQPEIDFLHGRVSANVFMSNYFNPALVADLEPRARQGIQEIRGKIE